LVLWTTKQAKGTKSTKRFRVFRPLSCHSWSKPSTTPIFSSRQSMQLQRSVCLRRLVKFPMFIAKPEDITIIGDCFVQATPPLLFIDFFEKAMQGT